MENDLLLQLFDAVKNGTEHTYSIQELTEIMCKKWGWTTPYTIQYKNLDYTPEANYDIILSPGNPVILTINDRFILEHFVLGKAPYYFKRRLEHALESLPKMHRILRHPVPLSKALAWKKDARSYVKIPAPVFEAKLVSSNQLEITFSVMVKDTLTKTEIRIEGDNPAEIKREAIKRISKIIFEDEELKDMFDEMAELRNHKKESNPSQINIGGNDDESRRERRIY